MIDFAQPVAPVPVATMSPEDDCRPSRLPRRRRERADWGERGPTKIYDRSKLEPGALLSGPAIVTEFDSTTVVLPGYAAKVDVNFSSLEGFLVAKVTVEGLRRAGRNLTRERFTKALESMHDVDFGGFAVSYSPTNHNGSMFVDLTIIGRDGGFKD